MPAASAVTSLPSTISQMECPHRWTCRLPSRLRLPAVPPAWRRTSLSASCSAMARWGWAKRRRLLPSAARPRPRRCSSRWREARAPDHRVRMCAACDDSVPSCRRSVPDEPAARAGCELALLDAYLRQHRMPMWSYFGGQATQLKSDQQFTAGDVPHAIASAQAAYRRGFTSLKIRSGADPGRGCRASERAIPQSADRARSRSTDLSLVLDANGGTAPSRHS